MGSGSLECVRIHCGCPQVGLHETYLNQCLAAFNNGIVKNWVEFFSQEWADALYHDRFQDLVQL